MFTSVMAIIMNDDTLINQTKYIEPLKKFVFLIAFKR
jgi:hypothetical protein